MPGRRPPPWTIAGDDARLFLDVIVKWPQPTPHDPAFRALMATRPKGAGLRIMLGRDIEARLPPTAPFWQQLDDWLADRA